MFHHSHDGTNSLITVFGCFQEKCTLSIYLRDSSMSVAVYGRLRKAHLPCLGRKLATLSLTARRRLRCMEMIQQRFVLAKLKNFDFPNKRFLLG